jgi:ABC-type multidrug transport system permease subunit
MRVLSSVDPFTYAVQAFKGLLLKNSPLSAVAGDLVYLLVFAAVMLFISTALFRRTL